MSFKSPLFAAVLCLAALPVSAAADTLHGPPRPGRTVVVRDARHGHHHRYARHFHRFRAPRAHVHRHGHCRYVEGHYVTRRKRVVIPGHHVERVVPARYAIRWCEGRYVRVCVETRRTVREWVPERVEIRRKRVWVRGRWVCC